MSNEAIKLPGSKVLRNHLSKFGSHRFDGWREQNGQTWLAYNVFFIRIYVKTQETDLNEYSNMDFSVQKASLLVPVLYYSNTTK